MKAPAINLAVAAAAILDRSTILRRLLLALIVIDGTIDWPFIRMAMKQVPCVRNQRTAPRAGRSAPGSRIAERPPSGGLLICVILDLCLPQLVVNDAVPPLPTDLPHRNCRRHVGLDLAHGRCRRAVFLTRANSEHTFCTVRQPLSGYIAVANRAFRLDSNDFGRSAS